MSVFDFASHGLSKNKYNKHAWVLGQPEIGERVWIGAFCLIDALYAPLKIGRGTDISSGVKITTHTTVKRAISERRFSEIEKAPVEIGEFCFIGSNAVILMGAKIGHHSVVAAGAVVPQFTNISPYSIVAGIPVKVVGSSKKFLKRIEKESISVVIPAFNEVATLEKVAISAKFVLQKMKMDYEIVLVNDGSTDGTDKIINKLTKNNKRIRAVHHKQNRGFTGAMRTCFNSAKKRLIFLAPADGQFNFTELPDFLEAVRGYDGAFGYRIKLNETIMRKIFSWGFHFLSRILFDIKFREISTVSIWRRQLVQSIKIESEDKSANFLPEMTYKCLKLKARFAEVPIHWHKRRGGSSKGELVRPMVIPRTLVQMAKLWWKVKITYDINSAFWSSCLNLLSAV
ncbi:glycosyltransferase [Candidatus Microgenomates bacterium]|nr:glycosyltransferase [Candidatus Microgenomates bacterium]